MNFFRNKKLLIVSIIMAFVALLIFLPALIFLPIFGVTSDSFEEKAESNMVMQDAQYDVVVTSTFNEESRAEAPAPGFTSTTAEAESFTFERMMIYRGLLRIEVEDIKNASEQVIKAIQDSKGYLVNSNQSENDVRYYAHYEFRIPVKGFHPLTDEIKNMSLGKITRQDIGGTDVTEEYLDIDSRLKAKRAYEKRLLELFNQATKTEDLLKISNDLERVQEEIERLLGRQKYLSYNAEYSTLIIEMDQYKNKVAPTATTWEKAVDGFNKSIEFIKDLFNALFIWTISSAPVLVLLLIILIISWQIRKKVKKNKRDRIPVNNNNNSNNED